MSLTRFQLVWGPDSALKESQEGGGWIVGESGSHPDSWSVQRAAGAGGEGVTGREGALGGLQVEVGREHRFALVLR